MEKLEARMLGRRGGEKGGGYLKTITLRDKNELRLGHLKTGMLRGLDT